MWIQVFSKRGQARGSGGCRSPSRSRGKAPVGGSGGQSPPETKADVKYLYNC